MKMRSTAAVCGPLLAIMCWSGADAMPAAHGPDTALIQPVAYGDLPTSGGHRRGGRKRGPMAKSPDPALPDLHGATREDADKQYRKKYGF